MNRQVLWFIFCLMLAMLVATSRSPQQTDLPNASGRMTTDSPVPVPSPDLAAGAGGPDREPIRYRATPAPTAVRAIRKPTIADARAWARRTLGAHQYACLHALVERESGWRIDATNRSGAYGLPQALPGSKMASAGSDWRTNPVTQLRWMAGYVHGRYGSACRALDHALREGWY
jgi:hypothetical protein